MSNLLKKLKKSGRSPQVVGTVASSTDLSVLPAVMAKEYRPDILELRLDLLGALRDQTFAIVSDFLPTPPILLTARRQDEGGSGERSFENRKSLIQRDLASASLIDIEIRSIESESWDELIREARSRQSAPLIIGSYHDFNTTPSTEKLQQVINRGMDAGVDLVKIATRLGSEEDIDRLEALLDSPPVPLSLMGMGEELGKASRIRLALGGSVLNYGFIAEESAPGQWQANEMAERLQTQPN